MVLVVHHGFEIARGGVYAAALFPEILDEVGVHERGGREQRRRQRPGQVAQVATRAHEVAPEVRERHDGIPGEGHARVVGGEDERPVRIIALWPRLKPHQPRPKPHAVEQLQHVVVQGLREFLAEIVAVNVLIIAQGRRG